MFFRVQRYDISGEWTKECLYFLDKNGENF